MAGNFSLGTAVLETAVDQKGLKVGLAKAQNKTKSWVSGLGKTSGLTAGLGLATVTAAAAAATAGMVALGAAAAVVGVTGLKMNASLEQMETRLETLTGMGKENLRWVRELSIATPFTTQTLGNALSMAKAYGFTTNEAKSLIQVVGDTTAALGGQGDVMNRIMLALGQMRGAGKIMGTEMRQLTEAGVDAWGALADAYGVSTGEMRKMVTDGIVPADEAIAAITESMKKNEGAMEAQSKTAKGLFESIKESFQFMAADITFPIFDKLKDALSAIMDSLGSSQFKNAVSQLTNLISDLTAGFNPAGITNALDAIISSFSNAIGFVQQLVDELRGLSPGDIMANAAKAVDARMAELGESLGKLETQHGIVIRNLNDDITEAAHTMQRSLEAIATDYAEKMGELTDKLGEAREKFEDSMIKLNRSTNRKLADNQSSLQDKLESMADSFNKKREATARAIADKQFNFEEKLTDLREGLEEKKQSIQENAAEERLKLNEELLAATTQADKDAIIAKIAVLDAEEQAEIKKAEEKEKKAEEKLKRRHDRDVRLLQEKLQREELEHNKAVQKERERAGERRARIQDDHAFAAAELQKRLGKEETDIKEQIAALAIERAAEEQKVVEQHARAVEGIRKRIAEENIAYEEQRQTLNNQANEDQARIMTQAAERAARIGEGPAHEIALMMLDLKKVFEDVSLFVDEHLMPAFNKISDWFVEHGPEINAILLTMKEVYMDVFGTMWELFVEDIWPDLQAAFEEFSLALELLGLDWDDVLFHIESALMVLGAIWIIAVAVFTAFVAAFAAGLAKWAEGWRKVVEGIVLITQGKLIDGILLALRGAFDMTLGVIIAQVSTFVETIIGFFTRLYDKLVGNSIIPDMVNDIIATFTDVDWAAIGKGIMDGMVQGIKSGAAAVAAAVSNAAKKAHEAAKGFLQSRSPSKLFANLGESIPTGIAAGIAKMSPAMEFAMENSLGGLASSTQNAISNTTNNLTINSNAQTEQVAGSFALMQTMAGA